MLAMQAAVMALALGGVGETVLLDFYSDACVPCRKMERPLERLQAAGYPLRKVNVDEHPELAAKFHVDAWPCFVLLFEGREVGRIVGLTSQEELEQLFAQAGVARAGAKANVARGQSPDGAVPKRFRFPSLRGGQSFLSSLGRGAEKRARTADRNSSAPPWKSQPGGTAGAQHRGPRGANDASDNLAPLDDPEFADDRELANDADATRDEPYADRAPDANGEASTDALVDASVRLKIDDGDGNSVGSGTIIDSRGGEALVLTCAHIFRDSQGKGKISVDLFDGSGAAGLAGSLILYDLKRDVALVSFSTEHEVRAARVAHADYTVQREDRVVSVGCNHGAEPTARASRVTSVDKFLGPPNLQVAGQPVQGRSGGGLFSADGQVIGVCNAADPEDDEGLYAALGSIHAVLREAHLLDVVLGSDGSASGSATARGTPPAMAARMPARSRQKPSGIVPTSAAEEESRGEDSSRDDMSREEQAVLDELGDRADEAEVICIVRPKHDPSAASEVIVLDRASGQFLRKLSQASREARGAARTARRAPARASQDR